MKKTLFPICLALLLMLACGCTSYQGELHVYNWYNYIDMELIPKFEQAYLQETGIPIKVYVSSYDTNEEMFKKLERGSHYDLICPSDYIIQDLADKNLIQPLDHERIAPLDTYSPWLLNFDYDRDNTYSVPYLYGTVGLLYNTSQPEVTREAMSTWEALWNPAFKQRIYVKYNIYDLYAITALYVKRKELVEKSEGYTYPREFKAALHAVLDDRSTEMVIAVSAALQQQKPLVKAYISGSEKDEMVLNRGAVYLVWSSEAGYCMDRNRSLEYTVPKEGSYVYIDSWAIPTSARNVDAAYAFLHFIFQKENAKRCMTAVGAPTAVGAAMEEMRAELEADSQGMFKGQPDEWKAQYIDALCPSSETLKRCWTLSSMGDDVDIIHRATIRLWEMPANED
jgi:spermidine/putrescine-binding protein